MALLAGWGYKFRKNRVNLPLSEYEKIWVEFKKSGIGGYGRYSPNKQLFIVLAMEDTKDFVFHYGDLVSEPEHGITFDWNGEDFTVVDFFDEKYKEGLKETIKEGLKEGLKEKRKEEIEKKDVKLARYGIKLRLKGEFLNSIQYKKVWIEFVNTKQGYGEYRIDKGMYVITSTRDDAHYILHYDNLIAVGYGLSYYWNGEDYAILDLLPETFQKKEEFLEYVPPERVEEFYPSEKTQKEIPKTQNFLSSLMLFGLLYFIFKYKKR